MNKYHEKHDSRKKGKKEESATELRLIRSNKKYRVARMEHIILMCSSQGLQPLPQQILDPPLDHKDPSENV